MYRYIIYVVAVAISDEQHLGFCIYHITCPNQISSVMLYVTHVLWQWMFNVNLAALYIL